MNLDTVLQNIQDWRSQLEAWGVTTQTLWLVGFVGSLLFLFSLREVLAWYLRVHQVRNEISALRGQLTTTHQLLAETRDALVKAGVIEEPSLKMSTASTEQEPTQDAAPVKLGKSNSTGKFRFDH